MEFSVSDEPGVLFGFSDHSGMYFKTIIVRSSES